MNTAQTTTVGRACRLVGKPAVFPDQILRNICRRFHEIGEPWLGSDRAELHAYAVRQSRQGFIDSGVLVPIEEEFDRQLVAAGVRFEAPIYGTGFILTLVVCGRLTPAAARILVEDQELFTAVVQDVIAMVKRAGRIGG